MVSAGNRREGRLFDHHPAPESAAAVLVLALIGELGFAQLLHDGTE
jgi:hypothetical protein